MSGRRLRPQKRNISPRDAGIGKKCIECMKYSRKTFYCTKERKVVDKGKEACVFFVPRHQGKSDGSRKF
jgi:hypothetical protein